MSRRKPSLILATRLESRRKISGAVSWCITIVANLGEERLLLECDFLKTRFEAYCAHSKTASQALDILMAESGNALQRGRFGATMRRDSWWIELLPIVVVLGAFSVYATWRAFEGKYYEFGPYLSPFYSPLFKPSWWPFSPAILILGGPLGFRATCYYYRKAYYRAFFLDPPACTVGEARHKYRGETAFPLILQNLHRYFLYVALIFLIILWYDAIVAFRFNGRFGIGIGSLVLLANISLLSLYTFSCHSLRHIVGGKVDCFSCVSFGGPRHSAWRGLSFLNEHHMLFAWLSLFSVGLADLYVRLAASGSIQDLRLL